MKPWSLKELTKNLPAWDALIGAKLQKVIYHPKKVLFFECYKQGDQLMFIDLRKPNCFIGFLPGLRAPKKQKKDSPISLFLRSRFENRDLKRVELLSEFGRVLRFHFGDESYMEVRLFGADVNLIAVDASNSLSFQKPKELVALEDNYEPPEYRELEKSSLLWWKEFQSGGPKEALAPEAKLETWKKSQLKKLNKEKTRLENQLDGLQKRDYRLMGTQLLESNGDILAEWSTDQSSLLDGTTWQEKSQFCFAQAKKNEAKLEGVELRLGEFELEIASVVSQTEVPQSNLKPKMDASKDLQKLTGAKTRSKNIAADLRIHIGRSAKENIALLRRAKPWFLWMHVRDIPGSHLIVEKNKGRSMTEEELGLAARELVDFSQKGISQESFDVQYSECRYIKPIKGDKLGRVKVTNENVLIVRGAK